MTCWKNDHIKLPARGDHCIIVRLTKCLIMYGWLSGFKTTFCKSVYSWVRIPLHTLSFGISQYQNLSWNKIMIELDKCDLLCSNCHKELHYVEHWDVSPLSDKQLKV